MVDKQQNPENNLNLPASTSSEDNVDFLELDESALTPSAPAPDVSTDMVVLLEPPASTGSDSDIQFGPASSPPTRDEHPTVAVDRDHVLHEDSPNVLTSEDSGISLVADSGISLASDSGISLASDSGISLASDSGISLVADSGISLESTTAGRAEPTVADAGAATEQFSMSDEPYKLADDADATQPFVMDATKSDEIPALDQTVLTDAPLSFSGKIEAGATVEELEVADDLEQVTAEQPEFASISETDEVADIEEAEELVDVTDEAFGLEGEEAIEEVGESQAELPTAPTRPKPSEPAWGALVGVSVIAASLFVGVNVWLVWEGLSTMWTGDAPSDPANMLISTLAGLM